MPAVTRHRYMQRNFYNWAAAWDPSQLPGIIRWQDTSNAGSITASGSPAKVSQHNDLSGAGNHLLQATGANQPTTGTVTINGLNVFDYDGANTWLAFAAWAASPTVSTTFVVVKQRNAFPGNMKVIDGRNSGNRHTLEIAGGDWKVYQGSAEIDSGFAANQTAAQLTLICAGDATSVVRRDGVAGTAGNAGTSTWTGMALGVDQGGGAQWFDGQIAESFTSNQVISGTDLTSAESYLKTKWGTP